MVDSEKGLGMVCQSVSSAGTATFAPFIPTEMVSVSSKLEAAHKVINSTCCTEC